MNFRLILTFFCNKKIIFFIGAIFIVVFLLAKPAHASFLSFLEDLFGSNKKNSEPPSVNFQTIPLLQAVPSPDPNNGRGGGDITINNNALVPDIGPMGTIADISENKLNSDQISIYVVRKNDNLSQIAKMFNISINTIRWANDLKADESIKIGQILVILPVTGIQYNIKKGDTIKDIAKKFNTDTDEILQFNNLTISEKLTEGETIIIPNGDYTEPEKENISPQKPKTASVPSYIGYYLRPIDGGRKSQGIHGYNAIDMANSCGTPVMASASGDVIIARNFGWNAGYGNYIVISHSNGTQTLYAHLNKTEVSVGWHVVKGQIIGYIGTTGRSTGCHVHFEIRGAKNPF